MANVNIRVDDQLKKDTEHILAELGLTLTTATTAFYKQIIRYGGIPFELKIDPFYGEKNMNYLKQVISDIETGKAKLVEHKLIEE